MIKSYIEEKEISKLWQDYKKKQDVVLRDKLIENYSPLLNNIAKNIYYSLPSNMEISDLVSYGFLGLIDAIKKFDIDKDIKFETYANFRIRGAIIDGIRKTDWLPRSLRNKQKNSDSSNDEFSLSSLDDPAINPDNVFFSKLDNQDLGGFKNPMMDFTSGSDNKIIIMDALKLLKDNEKKIILLYYFRNQTFKEIARSINVTESRICQIHKEALRKLRILAGLDYN